jgi:hypothetical protein
VHFPVIASEAWQSIGCIQREFVMASETW